MPEPIEPAAPPSQPPPYRVYRTRPRLLPGRDRDGLTGLRPTRTRPRRRVTPRRVLKWLVLAVVGWLLLSFVLFVLSAQFSQQRVDSEAEAQLSGGGAPIVSAQTVLVLGSDQRVKGTHEAGAAPSGPSRSDSIMLLRVGGGHSAKLSIPRDTVVDIPGHGLNKINAAFAFGGPALAIRTVKQFLGVQINHVVLINFAHFPGLVDAMGGIDYTGGCVVSRINGGFKNGGFTLRLKRGTTHINGKQALALSRTRKNECNPRENDLTRARRQQKVISAMKSRVFSPAGFIRLPFISWNAPKTLKTDMRGPALLGYAIGTALSGSPPTRVLPVTPQPGGGTGLEITDAAKQQAVQRFENG
jgi:LCP family protein required for cell wall assembly